MKKKIKYLFTFTVILFVTYCSIFSCAVNNRIIVGSSVQKTDIRLKGFRRSYLLHIPKTYSSQKSMPLMVVLHGAFSTAEKTAKETGFSLLAEKEGFIAAYPNGMGLFGMFQHWNAGHCCGKAAKDRVDDVGFIVQVIEDVERKLNIDSSRVYVTGFSNGGMLAYRFAAEKTNMLAAIAVLGASLGGKDIEDENEWQMPAPISALPVLIMHGKYDESVPFEGGESLRHKGRIYYPVKAATEFWWKHNGCEATPTLRQSHQGYIEIQNWGQDCEGTPVRSYTIKDWPHQWPGPYFTEQLEKEHPLYGFDASEVIWSFFKKYSNRPVISG